MGKISRSAIFEILNSYQIPGTTSSLVALKAVKGIDVDGARVILDLGLTEAYKDREEAIRQALHERLGALPGVEELDLEFQWEPVPQPEFKNLLPTVKHTVVVGSGKGGVGKSTVAANLACAAAQLGLRTGLMDADLYGPSMGMMFGVTQGPDVEEGLIQPIWKHGVKLMSMSFLLDDDRPVIWRGPMLNKALQQFMSDVAWGDLDLLVIDLPPGTGDTQISLVQNAKVSGAIVVSTPQDVAFLDAKKAISMFGAMNVPVLGIIENMSSFLCPHCHQETQIFGRGGVRKAAERMNLNFLGEVPIDLEIRAGGDSGTPLVVGHPDSPQTKAFMDMAQALRKALEN